MRSRWFTWMQMRALRDNVRELQAAHEAQISVILGEYHRLQQQVREYHKLLEAAMAPCSVDISSRALKSVHLNA